MQPLLRLSSPLQGHVVKTSDDTARQHDTDSARRPRLPGVPIRAYGEYVEAMASLRGAVDHWTDAMAGLSPLGIDNEVAPDLTPEQLDAEYRLEVAGPRAKKAPTPHGVPRPKKSDTQLLVIGRPDSGAGRRHRQVQARQYLRDVRQVPDHPWGLGR